MVYVNEKYEITVKAITGYSIDSTDNKYYDKCINVMGKDSFAHYSCYEMGVLLTKNGEKPLLLREEFISFTDFEGNYHEVDWFGKQRNYNKFVSETVTINMKNIKTPEEFQSAIMQMLGMPDFYGRNWDAYWDGITGLIELPNTLILDGWHEYKRLQPEDAELFEDIMKDYNELKGYAHCECIYRFYM